MLSTEETVDLHDKILRGDGGDKQGLVHLVSGLCLNVDKLEKTVHSLELEIARAKGWILGATTLGSMTGAVVVWVLETFVVRHQVH